MDTDIVRPLAMLLLLATGCGCSTSPISAIVSGHHAQGTLFGYSSLQRGPITPQRYVIWANDAQVASLLTAFVMKAGYPVVERARLDELFEEQRITLLHTPEDAQTILRVGRLAGATHVIFGETTLRPDQDVYGRTLSSYPVVTVRSVAIETGEIRWAGTASYDRRFQDDDRQTAYLANVAAVRAICPVEFGYVWYHPREAKDGWWCVKK